LLAPKLRKSADKSLSQPSYSHSNTICEIQLQKTIVLRMQPPHQATLTRPPPRSICNHKFKKRIELRTQEQPLVAEHRGGTHYVRNDCSHTPRTQGLPSSPPAATLHEKIQGFVLRLPPQHKRHHFPSSPLPFLTISLGHHCPSSPPCVIAYYSFVMYCYVMSSLTPPFINFKSHNSICP